MDKLLRLLTFVPFLLFSIGVPGGSPATPLAWQAKVDDVVLERAAQGEMEFILYLSEQADLSAARDLRTKREKGAFVYEQLTGIAQRTQKPILAALKKRGVEHRPYWIANMIWVRGDIDLVQEMARRADVRRIHANPRIRLDAPSPLPEQRDAVPSSPTGIEWNILRVRAPDVWSLGHTGEGVVVGGADTGYIWYHPALVDKYRGWDGLAADHNYNWHDATNTPGDPCPASPIPCDPYGSGHGTHTMGIMVGDDGAVNQIGMAPGAEWIGCRNMDYLGDGTPTTYSECYQWFIAPWPIGGDPFLDGNPEKAPDVINNSWACLIDEGCPVDDPDILLADVEAVRAAGIVTVHSAGNKGTFGCNTIDRPAAIYEASFTVGNTDINDILAGGSSRGPVTIDGSNRLKPNVSAPGTNIRSSINGRMIYGYNSGTSMAAPHAAGLVALMISAQPSLAGQVDEIETLIERSAQPLTPTGETCGGTPDSQIPNNIFGWGRIDAWAAFQTHLLEIDKSAPYPEVEAGDRITYTLDIQHLAVISPTHNVVLTDVLPANTEFITATLPHLYLDDTVRWDFPDLEALENEAAQLIVQTLPASLEDIINASYGVRSDDVPTVLGTPLLIEVIKYIYYFPLLYHPP